uniref:Uncharacterized protein n=1 Tax=Strongyloides venezuelensis TaxID=75913 RepID=A0A0K0FTB5_STRVS
MQVKIFVKVKIIFFSRRSTIYQMYIHTFNDIFNCNIHSKRCEHGMLYQINVCIPSPKLCRKLEDETRPHLEDYIRNG